MFALTVLVRRFVVSHAHWRTKHPVSYRSQRISQTGTMTGHQLVRRVCRIFNFTFKLTLEKISSKIFRHTKERPKDTTLIECSNQFACFPTHSTSCQISWFCAKSTIMTGPPLAPITDFRASKVWQKLLMTSHGLGLSKSILCWTLTVSFFYVNFILTICIKVIPTGGPSRATPVPKVLTTVQSVTTTSMAAM